MIFKIIIQCLFINLVYSISKHPILIIVSYDAFRYNFLDKNIVPQMEKLRKLGSYADYLVNAFPTKTFPNHHTIATGLYPESHGIIGNSYYDPVLKKVFGIGKEMYSYNDEIVPIWRKNEDEGDGRYSGAVMWPGATYPFQGKNITYRRDFDPLYDWFKRVDDVISWITDPEKPANLVMLYIEEPDTHGHAFGPNSKVVLNLLKKLDNVTQYLQNELVRLKLVNKVNVIHVSDHGMVSVTPPHFINVTQYLTPNTYIYTDASPVLQFIPNKGYEDEIYKKLKNASLNNGHFKVFKKNEYLDRWHYKNCTRSPPILVMSDVGYALDDLIEAAPKYAKHYNFTLTSKSEFGVHGYDYEVASMHPIFMARGPSIKRNHKVKPFNTVDLYNLFCIILQISPGNNNGTMKNIQDVLVKHNGNYTVGSILIISVGGIAISLTLISLAVIITLVMVKRQQSITTTAALNKRFPQFSIEAQHLLESEEA